MTEIRTTDREGLRGIFERGRPAGYWMARSEEFPRLWVGVDSTPGHLTQRTSGTFSEVLTWLMRRQGVIGPDGSVRNRLAERDVEYVGISVQAGGTITRTAPDEVEIAQRYTGFPFGKAAEKVKWPPKTKEREKKPKSSRPAVKFNQFGHHEGTMESNKRILELYAAGMSLAGIAKEMGMARVTVGGRISVMRAEGRIPDELRRRQSIPDETKAEVIRMAREGANYTQISKELGVSRSTASRIVRGSRR